MNQIVFKADESCPMNYLVFCPDNRDDLPLLVYLHGAGERGQNWEHLYRHGIPKLIDEGSVYNAVVLCPQCPAESVWDNVVKELKQIIDSVAARYGISHDRICITGSSMGGFGTWMMALSYPNFFAAAAPVAGGGMSWRGGNLRTTPVRAYHGNEDSIVPIVYSQLMVDAVNTSGGNAQLISMEGLGHNDGIDEAYRNTELISWLLAQRRTSQEQIAETLSELF